VLRLAKRIAPVAAIVAMLAATVTPGLAARSHFGNKFSLSVYTHMGPGAETTMIQRLANQWAAQNGGTVKVFYDTGSFQDFIQLVHSSKAPDVMFGEPDDAFGNIQAAGVLAPVPNGLFKSDDFLKAAWDSVMFGGVEYGVPLMMDNVAFVYNKKLVPHPPKTWDQLIAIAKKFPNTKDKTFGFLTGVTNGDFYFDYALFSGSGSYVFKQTSSGLDINDIGLGNAGAVKALTLIKSLVDQKLVPPSTNYSVAQGLFQKGKVGMFIDGTWDVGANRAALGKNFGAAPWPTLPGGGHPRPFAGVFDAFVNPNSPYKDIAYKFLQYMVPALQIPDLQTAGRIPALKVAAKDPAIAKDPVSAAYAASSAAGDLLPAVPAMSAVWTPAGNAIANVVAGKETPQQAAAAMLTQIKQGIAQQGH